MKQKSFLGWNLILALLPLLLATMPVSAAEGTRFHDMGAGHWAVFYVENLAEKGVFDGYQDGSFRPEQTVSSAEFIKMAVALGENESAVPNEPFSKGEHWAKPYYERGLSLGYYTRFDIAEAALDVAITRDKMALIVNAILGNAPLAEGKKYSEWIEEIDDVDSRTAYEYPIVRAYAAGILTGYPDGTFRPRFILSRCEAAVVIYRLNLAVKAKELLEQATDDELTVTKVIEGSVLSVEPEGTLTLTIREYDEAPLERLQELSVFLKRHVPEQSEDMLSAFADFAGKQAGEGGQGIRKQYFGERPVLMERIDETLRIFLFPVGYNSRTWDTQKGQVSEEFF